MNRYRPILEEKRVLVTVKAYPQPSKAYRETVCIAGVTDEGKWIRLFPVTFRNLAEGAKFKTYAWVTVQAWKTSHDPRPESYHIDPDSITVNSTISPDKDWENRWNILRPLVNPSLEALKAQQKQDKTSLGLIKPRQILDLVIEPAEEPEWSSAELEKLLRRELFDAEAQKRPLHLLEKIPFRFAYHFLCDDPACKGHNLSVISWEVMESFRRWQAKYEEDWQVKFREKYWDYMLQRDLHFYVGNMASHPTSWLIIGLYYPPITKGHSGPEAKQLPLF